MTFNKIYKAGVLRNKFSPKMAFNITLHLPDIPSIRVALGSGRLPSNAPSNTLSNAPSNVTSQPNVKSSLEIMMRGSEGVVIAKISTDDGSVSTVIWNYLYIPDSEKIFTHQVSQTIRLLASFLGTGFSIQIISKISI